MICRDGYGRWQQRKGRDERGAILEAMSFFFIQVDTLPHSEHKHRYIEFCITRIIQTRNTQLYEWSQHSAILTSPNPQAKAINKFFVRRETTRKEEAKSFAKNKIEIRICRNDRCLIYSPNQIRAFALISENIPEHASVAAYLLFCFYCTESISIVLEGAENRSCFRRLRRGVR